MSTCDPHLKQLDRNCFWLPPSDRTRSEFYPWSMDFFPQPALHSVYFPSPYNPDPGPILVSDAMVCIFIIACICYSNRASLQLVVENYNITPYKTTILNPNKTVPIPKVINFDMSVSISSSSLVILVPALSGCRVKVPVSTLRSWFLVSF